ncbi:tetraspanin-31 isoform X1 [Protobothrops mucrosquamatus]|uniref:tetraspanin-31 isoform X1 n=1 Tax=Protobothrops mucrosquamatus TaxID=103944 RepID=UPI0007757548|nr:tetraspanin-31 isoform X1 [Protobothrops mucrosquamatus]
MVCGGFACSRNALCALNVVYVLVGLLLIGVAAWGKEFGIVPSLNIIGGVIAVGFFLLLIAIVGLIGAINHHQVMLFFYMIILGLIFIFQFGISCACLTLKPHKQCCCMLHSHSTLNPIPGIVKYNSSIHGMCCGQTNHIKQKICWFVQHVKERLLSGTWKLLNDNTRISLENSLNCCGLFNNTESAELFKSDVDNCSAPCTKSKIGCLKCGVVLMEHADEAFKILGGVGLFFSFTEILGVWLAMRYRNQKDPRANPSAFL